MPIRLLPLAPALLVLSACRTGDRTAPGPAARAPDVEAFTVREAATGDLACYLTLEAADGTERREMAVFELCERDDLVGRRVRLTHEDAQVPAASCEGDPECEEMQDVRLVTHVDEVH